MLNQSIITISLKYQHQLRTFETFETFDLPDGSYNISEIQDYIEYISKKHETIGENAPILIYANTINNKVVFKIKSRYKLELLSKGTMKLLGSTKVLLIRTKIVKTYQN